MWNHIGSVCLFHSYLSKCAYFFACVFATVPCARDLCGDSEVWVLVGWGCCGVFLGMKLLG